MPLESYLRLEVFALSIWQLLNVTPKTLKNYTGSFNRNLAPKIGSMRISKISRKDIVEATALLSPQSKYQALMTLRVLFREAEARELISRNPMNDIKMPKIEVKPQKFLTWEEISTINFGIQNERIRFLALHGLRYGEAAALRPEDLHDGLVHINKSKYGPTKTISGIRTVPALANFVWFPTHQDGLRRALKPYGVTVHSLRKTYAYILKKANVHVTTAAKLMGHSNPQITMKIYTLVLDNEILQSGDAIRLLLQNG